MLNTQVKSGGRKVRSMSFSINCEVLDKITTYCAERGCSRSWFMSKALEHYLAECLEDKEDYETAATAWKEFEVSGEKGYTAEEARKMLGL